MNYAFKFIYKSYFKALLKMQIDDSKSNEFFFHQLTKTMILNQQQTYQYI